MTFNNSKMSYLLQGEKVWNKLHWNVCIDIENITHNQYFCVLNVFFISIFVQIWRQQSANDHSVNDTYRCPSKITWHTVLSNMESRLSCIIFPLWISLSLCECFKTVAFLLQIYSTSIQLLPWYGVSRQDRAQVGTTRIRRHQWARLYHTRHFSFQSLVNNFHGCVNVGPNQLIWIWLYVNWGWIYGSVHGRI